MRPRYPQGMAARSPIESGDQALIQIVDAALAESARLSGPWLVCRPGCTQCCMGPFPITQLDALRLRRGLAELEAGDPDRAARVRRRARQYVERMRARLPGDPLARLLDESCDFADSEPCPALDPEQGTCDLYAARPITCRTFGPPVRFDPESMAVCELCYEGATSDQIAACEVEIDPDGLEAALLEELAPTGASGDTIVAFALATSEAPLAGADTPSHGPASRRS